MLDLEKLITPEATELLKKTGSMDAAVASVAMHEFAQAIETPLRQAIFGGDIISDIYQTVPLEPGAAPEFPLDSIVPGTEKDYVAYTIPNVGRVPERNVEGDYVMVSTYEVGNSIDWSSRFAENARWDIVGRHLQVLRAGFTKKLNDDGWHTLLYAGVDRNILVYDGDASAGQFTKRLVSLMKTVMRRNGGGNSSSINRRKLTDLYVSPEALEDIRDWKVDQVDEVTRREIFLAPDGSFSRIFQVNLHDIDELGEDQEYELYATGQLSAVHASGDLEFVVGLDLTPGVKPFVMPQRKQIQIFEDPTYARQRKVSYWGVCEVGFGCLDGRFCVLGSF